MLPAIFRSKTEEQPKFEVWQGFERMIHLEALQGCSAFLPVLIFAAVPVQGPLEALAALVSSLPFMCKLLPLVRLMHRDAGQGNSATRLSRVTGGQLYFLQIRLSFHLMDPTSAA